MEHRKECFRNRFQQYYSRLCNLAYTYIGDRDECEDLVQDLFVSIWSRGKDELPEHEFASYMAIAVRNSCISYLRKKRPDTVPIDDYLMGNHMTADTLGGEDEEKHLEDILHEALAILPPRCREIFLMAKLHGLKYREIAGKMEISEKTVENQMTKAVKQLRAYIVEHRMTMAAVVAFVLSIIING